jgi:uncharacterized HAD superfamily protein
LVVDDSIASGSQMAQAKQLISSLRLGCDVLYCAAYATPSAASMVDLCFEVIPQPRLFEWNLAHHALLTKCCVDLDGVLCRDPRPDENDDGPQYRAFLESAEPLLRPAQPLGLIVTARLERYRRQTEEWLARHGVRYQRLVMLDLPGKPVFQKARVYSQFKADVYRSSSKWLFLESSQEQAAKIARLSGRPVLCIDTMHLHEPPAVRAWGAAIPKVLKKAIGRCRRMLELSRAARLGT